MWDRGMRLGKEDKGGRAYTLVIWEIWVGSEGYDAYREVAEI